MPIEVVTHRGIDYPAFQTNGNAARFCRPFALEVCKGEGFDIGCGKEEWAFPGAICIDPVLNEMYHAQNLPMMQVDYIHSSHCLEHVPDWVGTLEYWTKHIKSGGTLFLYLPDWSQTYWRVYSNRKHLHTFTPELLKDYLEQSGKYKNIFVSGVDAYNSFIAMAEKI